MSTTASAGPISAQMQIPLTGEPGYIEINVELEIAEYAYTFEHPTGTHKPFVQLALTPEHARDLRNVLTMLECLEADPAEAPSRS